jgi:CDP-glycerol glycerophosphotransferase
MRLARGVAARATTIGSRVVRYLATAAVAARARRPRRGHVPGLLSVVMPAHNVERFVDECLHSLRRQAYLEIEIIVVDDGSPDGTMRIVERHRRRDPRLRIVRRPNGGPSAARNTGVSAARGEFLTFVDPDDVVRAEGYRRAVSALRETASDFAVLSYDRLEHGRRRRPGPWISAAHATRRLRCTVEDAPDIQVNAVVWSKVFRRSFYDAAELRFLEGTIYEDQPLSARAFARARAFDILPDVVVSWRIRDDGTSITQQTASAENLAAHNAAVHASLAELDAAGHGDAADARALQLLANNMRLFIRHVDVADDGYWRTLQQGLRELVDRVPRDAYLRAVPAPEKVLNALILRDDRDRARAFVEASGMDLARFPTQRAGEGYVARLPFFGDAEADLPPELFVLADRQLSVAATVTDLRWESDGSLAIEGCAYIRNVDLAVDAPAVEVRAIDPTGRRTAIRTVQRTCPQPDEIRTHEHCDYRNGGFAARLDPSDLDPGGGPWHFEVEVTVPGVTRVGPLSRVSSAASASVAAGGMGAAYEAGALDGGRFGLRRVEG